MKDLYHLVTISDGQKDSNAILEVFRAIKAGRLRNDVKLLNYIREVPVSYAATIENIADDRIELTVHENQAVMMKHDKFTLIRSSHFPSEFGVHSFVALANPTKGKAILVRFAYAQIRAERRTAVRVEVHHRITGTFTGPSGEFSGELLDISVNGASLKTLVTVPAGPDESGRFTCPLPNGMLDVPARFLRQIESSELRKAVLILETAGKMESVVSQFIFNEQIDIIRELKERYV